METGKVRAWYDKTEDIFYMLFKEVTKAIAEATA